MSSNVETKMSRLNRLWTSIARYVKALEGMDDPVGDYMFSLGKRVDKLERDLSHLESQLHPRAGSDAVPDHGDSLISRSGQPLQVRLRVVRLW